MEVKLASAAQGRIERHVAKHKNRMWSNKTLEKAMNAMIDDGMNLRVASRVYTIPTNSFRDHLYGKTRTKQKDNKQTLKADEEKNLVDYVFKMQDLGHPLT